MKDCSGCDGSGFIEIEDGSGGFISDNCSVCHPFVYDDCKQQIIDWIADQMVANMGCAEVISTYEMFQRQIHSLTPETDANPTVSHRHDTAVPARIIPERAD